MELKFRKIDGLNTRYAQQSTDVPENILLLSPLPESILAFCPLWPTLSTKFNLLAIDLPGMGHSEGRNDLYSTRKMAGFVYEVIESFQFHNPHIVGPDIGTPIALFCAKDFPYKIKSLIVSGGACVYPFQVGTILHDLLNASDLSGFLQTSASDAINRSVSELEKYQLPSYILDDYLNMYNRENFFPHAVHILRSYLQDIPLLNESLDNLPTPVQIIWGQHDGIATVQNAHSLHERLPKNNMHIIANGKHYTWEENAEEYLRSLMKWIDGGWQQA
jgi:pimeloyl-ACP methyl ester carboxylesterase